jgi:hypothetical protein
MSAASRDEHDLGSGRTTRAICSLGHEVSSGSVAVVADLLISRLGPGVAVVRSIDPFDAFEIYRIDRGRWQDTPERPGVYVLHGVSSQGKLTVYVGMSTTNMRSRIRSHHVNPGKNWFGVLFAVPVASPLLCPAIEAELIGQLIEADVVDVIANVAAESRHRGADDVHLEPAVEKIRDGLQLLLGSDIFTPADVAEPQTTDDPIARMTPLAREYKGRAAEPRARISTDPREATHGYAGAGVIAWGRFEGDDPDKRFRVLASSGWRRPVLNPEATTYNAQVRVGEMQEQLVDAGVLDAGGMKFTCDHVFDNWTAATRVVGGRAQLSGAYNWQLLKGAADE